MQWTKKRNRFFFWGDSLGTVLAYEVAHRIQEDGAFFRRQMSGQPKGEVFERQKSGESGDGSPDLWGKGLLGLIVSGNAGPTVAAVEQGMGNNTSESCGKEILSVADMTLRDWKTFYIASSGTANAQALEDALADDDLAEQALRPLIADCTVYESYKQCDGLKLRDPIFTLRGASDSICDKKAMRSWNVVAGGRIEHKEIQQSGHMLVRDAPRKLAQHIANIALSDFSSGQNRERVAAFRAAYAARGQAPKPAKRQSMALSSPMFMPSMSGYENNVPEFHLEVLAASENMTPKTQLQQNTRVGNLHWRREDSFGSFNNLQKLASASDVHVLLDHH